MIGVSAMFGALHQNRYTAKKLPTDQNAVARPTPTGSKKMSYKDILVYLDDGVSNEERVKSALSIAEAQGARPTGVAVVSAPPKNVLRRMGLGSGEDLLKKSRALAEDIVADFVDRVKQSSVEHATRVLEGDEGRAPRRLAQLARHFDLAIMRQANPDRPNADLVLDIAEEVLFASGRPVFFMPYIGAHRIPCERALVAWDGSAAATRAVHDALPLMSDMKEVIILVVDDDRREWIDSGRPGDDIAAHLSAHGIDCRVERVLSGGSPTSTMILNQLSDDGADLLVMGGYGTSKLREVVLGGVTRTIMGTITVPVFMSH